MCIAMRICQRMYMCVYFMREEKKSKNKEKNFNFVLGWALGFFFSYFLCINFKLLFLIAKSSDKCSPFLAKNDAFRKLIFWEHLKQGKTVNSNIYCEQLKNNFQAV